MRSSPRHVLLFNPWIYDFSAYDFWMKPLGLLYMGGLIQEKTACRVTLIDCLDRFHPSLSSRPKNRRDGRGPFPKIPVEKPRVLKDIPRKFSRYGLPVSTVLEEMRKMPVPDVVLMSCVMTYWYPGVELGVELVREVFGSVPIILGGIYPTLAAGHARSLSGIDFVVEGRGEDRLFPILGEIFGDRAFPSYAFPALEDLPPPAVGLLRNRSTMPVLTSRGCPLACTYCASPLLNGTFEQRSASSVLDEICHFQSDYGVNHFAFYDDALLVNKSRHIIPILEGIARRKMAVSFHTPNGLHAKAVDSRLARLLRSANVRSIYLSLESLSEKILRDSSQKVAAEDLEKALLHLETAGYRREDINVFLICGLPGQTAGEIIDSILFVNTLGAVPRLSYFSPVPGTAEWLKLVSRGVFRSDSDPLLSNKLVFPYVWGSVSPGEFSDIKRLLNRLYANRQGEIRITG